MSALLKFLRFLSCSRCKSGLILLPLSGVLTALLAATDNPSPPPNFIDVAEKAGLTMTNVFGGRYTKKYIIETTGTGVAIFDYDNDGWPDIFIVNGTTLEPAPGETPNCLWKGVPVMCGPKGLKGATNLLYKNLGDSKFKNVSAAAGIEKTNGHYCFSVSTLDFDDDGWPDIFIACDSTPSILYRNNHDGTFTDVAVVAGAAFNEDGREQAGMGSAVADYDGDGTFTEIALLTGTRITTQLS